MSRDGDRQVVIYLDDPRGQLVQTTLSDWRGYWWGIGWRILDRPPELPGMATPAAPGDQVVML